MLKETVEPRPGALYLLEWRLELHPLSLYPRMAKCDYRLQSLSVDPQKQRLDLRDLRRGYSVAVQALGYPVTTRTTKLRRTIFQHQHCNTSSEVEVVDAACSRQTRRKLDLAWDGCQSMRARVMERGMEKMGDGEEEI